MSRCKSFSVLVNCFLSPAAFSTSTRTPLNFISTRHGNRLVSKLNMSHRSCWVISCCNACHNFSVTSASRSAYSPTNGAGKRHISALGLTPQALAASVKTFSFLPMPINSLEIESRVKLQRFSLTKLAAIIVSIIPPRIWNPSDLIQETSYMAL